MSLSPPCIVVVAHDDDTFASCLVAKLQADQVPTQRCCPAHLGGVEATLEDNAFSVNGAGVAGIVLRTCNEDRFSADYVAGDQGFCHAEVRAVWGAALHLESVLAINRMDPALWFQGNSWSFWRRKCQTLAIPLASCSVNVADDHTVWMPAHGYRQLPKPPANLTQVWGTMMFAPSPLHYYVLIDGCEIGPELPHSLQGVRLLLRQEGLLVAEVVSNAEGQVLTINPMPTLSEPDQATHAGDRLLPRIHDHLHHW